MRKILTGVLLAALVGAPLIIVGPVLQRSMASLECVPASYPESPLSTDIQFSDRYPAARARFLDAAADNGITVESLRHQLTGPHGENLFTDIAWIGPANAPTVLLLISGTHGVEGFAGSAIQTGLLQDGIATRLPPSLAILMVHAINPWGMAHLRRFNEDNIDVNRNGIDHRALPPENPGYQRMAALLAPVDMNLASEFVAWSGLLWNSLRHGRQAVVSAISQGQYSHPRGLFYGGDDATWSSRILQGITVRHLGTAQHVIVLDIHTGLGAFGNAALMVSETRNPLVHQRAARIWGDDKVDARVKGTSVSVYLNTTLKDILAPLLPDTTVTPVTLEFGTVPRDEALIALRTENWLHHHGGPGHPRYDAIKTCLTSAFNPNSGEWQMLVWKQGREVVESVLAWARARPTETVAPV